MQFYFDSLPSINDLSTCLGESSTYSELFSLFFMKSELFSVGEHFDLLYHAIENDTNSLFFSVLPNTLAGSCLQGAIYIWLNLKGSNIKVQITFFKYNLNLNNP
jgi:hypothetical protein